MTTFTNNITNFSLAHRTCKHSKSDTSLGRLWGEKQSIVHIERASALLFLLPCREKKFSQNHRSSILVIQIVFVTIKNKLHKTLTLHVT